MEKKTLESAIICIPRPDLQDSVKQELRALGIEDIIVTTVAERCIEEMKSNPESLLILDWGIGATKAQEVLEATRDPLRIAVRPILLLSMETINGLDSIAREYYVLQLLVGEISRNVIRERLKAIVKVEGYPEEIRQKLKEAAEARACGDWATAGLVLEDLYIKNPDQTRIGIEYAENLFHEGDLAKAAMVLDGITNEADPDVRALNLLGRIQMKSGRYEDATITLGKAKVLSPLNIDRLLNLADAYLQTGYYARAKSNYEDVLRQDPKNAGAVAGMGRTLLLEEDINAALVFMKQLSGPLEMASVFNSAAVLNMKRGNFDAGMRLYQVAIDTIGDDAVICSKLAFNMGIGYWRAGQKAMARKCFGIALRLDPTNEKARTNYDSLSNNQKPLQIPDSMKDLIVALKATGATEKASAR